jgi:hypothetical protein
MCATLPATLWQAQTVITTIHLISHDITYAATAIGNNKYIYSPNASEIYNLCEASLGTDMERLRVENDREGV